MMAIILLDWLVWIGLALLVIVLVNLWLKVRRIPPGPWGWPFFGYYFNLDVIPHSNLMELYRKYGPVFSFRTIGGTLFIVVNGIETIKEVLVSRADEFIGRPVEQNFLNWVDDGYGILQEEGEVWKEQKRFFLNTTKGYGFGKLDIEGYKHEVIKETLEELKKSRGSPVNLYHYICHVTCNVISRILSSQRYSITDSKIRKINQGILDLMMYFTDKRLFVTGPMFEHVVVNFTPSGRSIKAAKKIVQRYISEVVDDHIRTLDDRNPRDFIDSYLIHLKNLEAKGQLKGSSFNMLRLRKVTYGMYIEGTGSVSGTICSLLDELSKHQDVQKKAQKALDAVVGRERLPSWMDKKNLPYIDAIILELFRTSLIFAISTYYSNFEEATIRGYRIPKRSFIVANLHSVNNDPKIYPDPYKFDPERFLDEGGKRIKQEPPIPFGVGKRSCPGESLATMEVFVIIASILQNFTLYHAGNDKIRLEPRPI